VLLDETPPRVVDLDRDVARWDMAPDGTLIYEVTRSSPRGGIYAIP
jgi:hypothetical protein